MPDIYLLLQHVGVPLSECELVCVFVKQREKEGEEASKRETKVQVGQFQVSIVYYNGILMYRNFSGYFKLLIIF